MTPKELMLFKKVFAILEIVRSHIFELRGSECPFCGEFDDQHLDGCDLVDIMNLAEHYIEGQK